MTALEVDPSLVQPGWTALVVTLLMAAALVVLFLSMRRQMRRIHVPDDDVRAAREAERTDGPSEADPR